MTCPKCYWIWTKRTDEPKRCPRCGKWLVVKPKRGLKSPQRTALTHPMHPNKGGTR